MFPIAAHCNVLLTDSMFQFSDFLPDLPTCLVSSCHFHVLVSLSRLCVQVPRAVTFLSTTCHRSSPTPRYCRCSCPSVTSSLLRCLSTAPPTRANASVSHVALLKVVVMSVMVIVSLWQIFSRCDKRHVFTVCVITAFAFSPRCDAAVAAAWKSVLTSFALLFLSQGLWVLTTPPVPRLPSRPWTASRLAWRDWRCSWRGPRTPTGLTEGGEWLCIDGGGFDRQLQMCLEVKETEWM